MRRLSLLFVPLMCAVIPSSPLKAQQLEPGETNYYLISAALAVGAVGSFAILRNYPGCPNGSYDTLQPVVPEPGAPPPETNCNAREDLRIAVTVIGIGCAAGAVWALVHAIRGDAYKSAALINVARGTRGSLRVPDIAYSAPTRGVRVLLVHAAF
jgi:hypothetical protein